jgi:hypothetical protein
MSITEREVSSKAGRLYLMGIVFIFFLSSLIVVLWLGRGGGISYDTKITAMGRLAAFYVPLFTLMTAFYFGRSKGRASDATVPFDAFFFAAAIVTLWVITPIFLLMTLFIEDVLTALERIKPYGDSLALLAVGYYFSKDHIRRRSAAGQRTPE